MGRLAAKIAQFLEGDGNRLQGLLETKTVQTLGG